MIKMQGRYTLENENSSSHSGEVTLQTSWFGHREKLSLQSRLRLLNSVFLKGQVIRATFSHNCWLLPVLPSSLSIRHTTNFDVASCGSLRKSCVVIGRQCVFV